MLLETKKKHINSMEIGKEAHKLNENCNRSLLKLDITFGDDSENNIDLIRPRFATKTHVKKQFPEKNIICLIPTQAECPCSADRTAAQI